MKFAKKSALLFLIFVLSACMFSVSGFVGSACNTSHAAEGFLFGGEQVYLGGSPIGLSTLGEGLYVENTGSINSKAGLVTPLSDKNIDEGDILLSVNGIKVNSRADVAQAVKEGRNEMVLSKNGNLYTVVSVAVREAVTNSLRLGLFLSSSIEGVGTLTFVRKDGSYCALGHHIASADKKPPVPVNKGIIYGCSVSDVRKSSSGTPGQLCGNVDKKKVLGTLDRNTSYGIYGRFTQDNYKSFTLINASSRLFVNSGKAYMYTTLQGEEPQAYEVEIITASLQPKLKEKGMLIKVTDKRLIDKCGGIVQGMSGSPLVQNGRLIGAVTHVIINEPLTGYAIYADFLFDVSYNTSDKLWDTAAAALSMV